MLFIIRIIVIIRRNNVWGSCSFFGDCTIGILARSFLISHISLRIVYIGFLNVPYFFPIVIFRNIGFLLIFFSIAFMFILIVSLFFRWNSGLVFLLTHIQNIQFFLVSLFDRRY